MPKSEKENKRNFRSYSADNDNVRQRHIEALKPHLQDSYRKLECLKLKSQILQNLQPISFLGDIFMNLNPKA